ncbi:MAG: NAD-dependent epimerase/dehydratase family protein, partial [Burkholderiales bacterium]|nr:NAD-dependent epimerase/dehydratase family protein [Burkholderiales bacterium]
MHTVLVTGSSGFVGSALVEKLDSIGFSVKPTVRRATGIKNEVVIGDIESYKNWQKLLAGTDVVIHLAARAHILNDTVEDPLAAFRKVNTQATIQLARECVKAGVKRFI